MVIICISGAVGSGKTTISKDLGRKLDYKIVPLNELASDFKLNNVDSLQTFDFDLDKLLDFVENKIKVQIENGENVIYEGHFAHFIDPNLVDILFIINRDLKELKKEYVKRGYNEQKIKDNLEVESFNLCFYEAIENGYGEEVSKLSDLNKKQNSKNTSIVYSIDNNSNFDSLKEDLLLKIKNFNQIKK